jgi:hypothetical protein
MDEESTELSEDTGLSDDDDIGTRQMLDDAWDDAELNADEPEQISDQREDKGLETASIESSIKIPKSWSKEASEWLSQPLKDVKEAAEVRRKIAEYAATRQEEADRDYTSKTQQLARERETFQQRANSLNGVYKTLEPKLQEFHLRGVDPTAWMNEVLALDNLARTDKRAALVHLAQKWQVDPRELIQAQQAGQTIPPELQKELGAIKQELHTVKQRERQQEQERQQAQAQRGVSEVATFRNAVDAQGQPIYPHFEQERQDMMVEVNVLEAQYPNANPQELLREAYERSTWKRPDIRKAMLEQQQKQKEAAERAQAAERVTQAKRAASPLTSSPNGQMSTGYKTLREELEAAYEDHART